RLNALATARFESPLPDAFAEFAALGDKSTMALQLWPVAHSHAPRHSLESLRNGEARSGRDVPEMNVSSKQNRFLDLSSTPGGNGTTAPDTPQEKRRRAAGVFCRFLCRNWRVMS